MMSLKRLKDKSISVALACVAVTAVAIVSFLPKSGERRVRRVGRFHSWGQLLAFASVAFVVAKMKSPSRVRVVLFFVSLVLGFGIESEEHSLSGNPVEWRDVLVE